MIAHAMKPAIGHFYDGLSGKSGRMGDDRRRRMIMPAVDIVFLRWSRNTGTRGDSGGCVSSPVNETREMERVPARG